MVKLPDYRAQRGLNTGSAPLVQTDRSGLAQVGAVGHAVQGAGQEALRVIERRQEMERQKEDFAAKQQYAQMNTLIEQDRVSLLEQSPEDGSGFTDGFMNETLSKRQAEFFQKIPERLHEQYGQQLQTDTLKWDGVARQNELDRLYANTATVIGEQSNELLNSISLDAASYDDALKSGLGLIDASPFPPIKKAEAKREWEAAALKALAIKMIEDDPEQAQKALGGGSEATQVGTWLQGFLQSESGGNWNAWFGDSDSKEDLSKLSLGQILKRQDEPGNDAAGLIQIVPDTLRNVMSKYGYSADTKFTPQVQAEMALLLMREKGLNKWLAGDMSDEKFANSVASVWAGLKKSDGRGAYDGDGVNKGTQSHGVTVAQLQDLRGLVQKDDKLRAWLGNPKVSNAPAIAAGGGEIAEVFHGMDYADRLKALNFAEKGLADQQSAIISEIAALKGSIQLQIATDDPNLTPQDILESPLKDSDKAQLINSYEAARKEQRNITDYAARIDGGAPFDPYSTDDRKGIDGVYDRDMGDRDVLRDEEAQKKAQHIFEQTGIVPKTALNQLRRGAKSSDPAEVAAAGSVAANLQKSDSGRLLSARDGGSAVNDVATTYRLLTENLGYKPVQAGEHMILASDPENIRKNEALSKTEWAKDYLKEVTPKKLTNALDGMFRLEPSFANEQMSALAVTEFKEFWRTALVEHGGDKELAEEFALQKFKSIYAPSKYVAKSVDQSGEAVGKGAIVRYPIELTYPMIRNSHDWVAEQARAELQAAGIEAFEAIEVMGVETTEKAPLPIYIQPSPETEADVVAGVAPRYQLFYETKAGVLQQYEGFFHADYESASDASLAEAEGRWRGSRSDHIKRSADPVQRVFDDAARKDAQGDKAGLLDGFDSREAN